MKNKEIPLDMVKGVKHKTNGYGDCYIVEYVTSKKVVVGFPGYCHTVTVQAGSIRRGQVKNLMYPSVYGVGYVGIGEYTSKKHKKAYSAWNGMLERCYSERCHKQHPTYIGCTTAKEWHNFQTFAEWYFKELKGTEDLYLDKDIIIQGNKVYGPETCAMVSREVNNSITDHGSARGEFKLGVTFHKNKNKFGANYSILGKRLHIGYFTSEDEAHEAYKRTKYEYLKDLSSRQTDERIKQGLLNWVIPEY